MNLFGKVRESWYHWFPFWRLFQYAQGARRGLYGNIGLIFLGSLCLMISAKLLGNLADALYQHQNWDHLWPYAVGICCLEAGHIIGTYRGRVGLARVTNRVSHSIREKLFRKIASLPMTYFDRNTVGATITRLTNDVESVESFFSGSLAKVMASGIAIANVIIAMLVTDLRMGGIIAMASLPSMVFIALTRRPILRWLRDYKVRASDVNSLLAEFLKSFKFIKATHLEEWSSAKLNAYAGDLRRSGIMVMSWNSLVRPLTAFMCAMPILVILWWGGQQALAGTVSIGLLISYVRYAERFLNPVVQISQEINVIQEAFTSSERIRQVLDEPEEGDVLGHCGHISQSIHGGISFTDIHMDYGADPILRGVNLSVPAGAKVGLVGRTGSGKSTTVSLISQLYPYRSGRIEIDGIPLEEWDRPSLRSQIGYVSQDVVIFAGSLRDNLLVALEPGHHVADEELLAVAERTGLASMIRRMPVGLDSEILDQGENLSAGERQLVGITRMLLRDPKILILDEVTSHVDEKTEAQVQQAIKEIIKGRTTLVIAHRLNTITACDQILVFDKGRIVEAGPHQELLARGGLYTELVQRGLSV